MLAQPKLTDYGGSILLVLCVFHGTTVVYFFVGEEIAGFFTNLGLPSFKHYDAIVLFCIAVMMFLVIIFLGWVAFPYISPYYVKYPRPHCVACKYIVLPETTECPECGCKIECRSDNR